MIIIVEEDQVRGVDDSTNFLGNLRAINDKKAVRNLAVWEALYLIFFYLHSYLRYFAFR